MPVKSARRFKKYLHELKEFIKAGNTKLVKNAHKMSGNWKKLIVQYRNMCIKLPRSVGSSVNSYVGSHGCC